MRTFLLLQDTLNTAGNLLGNPASGTALCYVQAVSTQFFCMASILWTTVIAFVLHRTVRQHLPISMSSLYIFLII
jgi:hypothetical protein